MSAATSCGSVGAGGAAAALRRLPRRPPALAVRRGFGFGAAAGARVAARRRRPWCRPAPARSARERTRRREWRHPLAADRERAERERACEREQCEQSFHVGSPYSASAPVSPVRMRTTCSRSKTKILPSPILPVLAAFSIGFDHAVEQVVLDRGLDLHLRQEIDDVFGAAVELGVALLPAEALDFGDGDALHADRRQGFADLVELERLDDCGDEFHGFLVSGCDARRAGSERLLDVGDELAARTMFLP